MYKVDIMNGSATDSNSYKLISVMKGHTSTVTNLDWSSNGKFLQVSERRKR